jgi:hypothetical protein
VKSSNRGSGKSIKGINHCNLIRLLSALHGAPIDVDPACGVMWTRKEPAHNAMNANRGREWQGKRHVDEK